MTLRVLQSSGLTTDKDPVLDLDDPKTNFNALLKLRGDLFSAELDALSDDIHTYSRGEIMGYRRQMTDLKEHYKDYILKLNNVAKKHLSAGYRHYN